MLKEMPQEIQKKMPQEMQKKMQKKIPNKKQKTTRLRQWVDLQMLLVKKDR